MKNELSGQAITATTSELSKESLAELRALVRRSVLPVPENALKKLFVVACSDTGSGQVVRFFLFWLAGHDEPTGFKGQGALELRRLDPDVRGAAFEVLTWWSGSTESDKPLYKILTALDSKFSRGG